MSVMEYDNVRRYSPHSLSFPDYYYDERNAPLAISQHSRADPRGYPIGGPVGSPRGRPGVGRDELTIENGPQRRRIAVACARCRKRKIRCSGDPGNGAGCTNCKQAGIEASYCQFHRVGSDNVHKVMDNFHMANSLTGMANSNGMMPIYPAAADHPMYTRPMASHNYPQIEAKSMYSSAWTVPYSEETSPVDTYGLDQPAAYLPNPMTSTSMYGASCRWTHPTSKPLQQGSSTYYDQADSSYSTHGLPYMQTNNFRSTATSEALPLLNMSSLSLTLPERPHPRQRHMIDGAVPQRQLPIPQPSPAQTSRNVVDQLQDQRLRSGQATNASSADTDTIFAKPLLPWSAESGSQVNSCAATSTGSSTQLPATSDDTQSYLATTTSRGGATNVTRTASQLQLNFSSSSLLDAMIAPAPTTTYSNFREARTQGPPATHMAHHNSQTNRYSCHPERASKRNSRGGESLNAGTLVNGRAYTPLPRQQSQSSSGVEILQRETFENGNLLLQRSSMGNLNSSF